MSIFHLKTTTARTAQRAEVATTLERLTNLEGQRADICTLATLHANLDAGEVILQQLHCIDVDTRLLELYLLSGTRKLICTHALHLLCRVERG